ncbi:MAG: DUF4917 domain-containing protein [Acidobacteria bacterium]|nr:MAG: DUF4917 domain-containing protein [Acidobacteriota bacterium]
MKLLTFEDALRQSEHHSRRHLLLGNGFSIACRPNIFIYKRLFEQADFSTLSPHVRLVFESLQTNDFERVIKLLRDFAMIAEVYGIESAIAQMLRNDSDRLKELLVSTIAKTHPERPSDITESEYVACKKFLSNFDDTYTVNYDLLLYWTHMHDGERMVHDDGFRTSDGDIETGTESAYVVWEPGTSHEQNIWFLHGALHVFDSGTEIQKYTWTRTGVRLIEQTRDALRRDLFPVFVAEGTSSEKLERIRHCDYLAKALRSFQSIQQCLFIHGHSLAENDEHILKLIEQGKITDLYIGLHGDPASPGNQKIVRRSNLMKSNRRSKRELNITYYDSDSALVWGHTVAASG